VPAEIGQALEPAGIARFPGAGLAFRCGDGMTDAGQTYMAQGAAVLDDQHQGEDQHRSHEYASHVVNIGI
jgi:hypothetical protein